MKEREQLVLEYLEAYKHFNIENMMVNLDVDILFQNITNGVTNLTVRGKDAFKKQAEEAKSFFTERKQTAIAFKHSTDKVEVSIEYHAVLATDLPNGLKKGDALELQGRSIFTFKENRIIEITDIS
jgi:hypothetical protein